MRHADAKPESVTERFELEHHRQHNLSFWILLLTKDDVKETCSASSQHIWSMWK